MSPIIAPSILAADLAKLREEIQDVEASGADWLHIDVMDGKFVPPITFGDNIVKAIRPHTKLFLDVHLMITEPQKQIQSFAEAGADQIIIHTEICSDLPGMIEQIHSYNIKAGVAVNPETDIEQSFPALPTCDLVLVMTVNPGWGGQTFMTECLPKIEALKAECDRLGVSPDIEVDGGINQETALDCKNAGANVLVAGSYIFGQTDRKAAIASLK